MVHYNQEKLEGLNNIFKINLINSCSGYKPANLIGSVSSDGDENVAVFSSVVHIGSKPPLLGFFVRPSGEVPRNTYKNIKETKRFTINHIFEEIIDDAHHTSAKYDEKISEFNVTNLSADYKKNINPPFVKNSPVQLLMEFVQEYDIKENNTTLIVGKIIEIFLNENIIENDGYINLAKGKIATVTGLDGYSVPELKTRQGYQRPKPNII